MLMAVHCPEMVWCFVEEHSVKKVRLTAEECGVRRVWSFAFTGRRTVRMTREIVKGIGLMGKRKYRDGDELKTSER